MKKSITKILTLLVTVTLLVALACPVLAEDVQVADPVEEVTVQEANPVEAAELQEAGPAEEVELQAADLAEDVALQEADSATTWTVVLNANGGTFGGGQTQVTMYVEKGTRIDDNGGHQVASQENKILIGWASDPEGTKMVCDDTHYETSLGFYVPTKDCTLYAIWADAVTLTYHCRGSYELNGEKIPVEGYTLEGIGNKVYDPKGLAIKGEKAFSSIYPYNDENAIFYGWALDEACTNIVYVYGEQSENFQFSEDTDLYAVWKPAVTIESVEDVIRYTGINANDPQPVAEIIHYSTGGEEKKVVANYLLDALSAQYGVSIPAPYAYYQEGLSNPSAGTYPASYVFVLQDVSYNVIVKDPPALKEGQVVSFENDKTSATTNVYYSFTPAKTGTYVFTATETNTKSRMAQITLYQNNKMITSDAKENPSKKTDTCTQFSYKLQAGKTYGIRINAYSPVVDRNFTFSVTNADLKSLKATLSKSSYKYTGKAMKPAVTIKDGSVKLTEGVDYTVSYKNNKNGGTATVTMKGKGMYTGTVSKTFKITNAPQTIKAVAKTVKAAKAKKKAQTVTGAITGAKGTTTYTKVAKGSSKNLSINKKTGKITVKKGTPKGTYKIKVKVVAKGNTYFKKTTKTLTVTVKVK